MNVFEKRLREAAAAIKSAEKHSEQAARKCGSAHVELGKVGDELYRARTALGELIYRLRAAAGGGR